MCRCQNESNPCSCPEDARNISLRCAAAVEASFSVTLTTFIVYCPTLLFFGRAQLIPYSVLRFCFLSDFDSLLVLFEKVTTGRSLRVFFNLCVWDVIFYS